MFKLNDQFFISEIQAIAKNYNCTEAEAADKLIMNLNTFRTNFRGTGQINYHFAGQAWCSLTSQEKLSQKAALQEALKRNNSERRRRRS